MFSSDIGQIFSFFEGKREVIDVGGGACDMSPLPWEGRVQRGSGVSGWWVSICCMFLPNSCSICLNSVITLAKEGEKMGSKRAGGEGGVEGADCWPGNDTPDYYWVDSISNILKLVYQQTDRSFRNYQQPLSNIRNHQIAPSPPNPHPQTCVTYPQLRPNLLFLFYRTSDDFYIFFCILKFVFHPFHDAEVAYFSQLLGLVNKYNNRSMNIEGKRRQGQPRDSNPNMNYLNFIKKNHQLIQEDRYPHEDHSLAVTNSPLEYDNQAGRKATHSLGKFRMSGQYSQTGEIVPMSESSDLGRQGTVYQTIQSRYDQVAAIVLSSKTKHAKHEAAKELLLSMHRNRSPNKGEAIRSTLDRYMPDNIPDLHLKFPHIEKKALAGFNYEPLETDTARPQEEKDRTKFSDKKTEKEKVSIESRFKMKEELYGLLPVFRTPALHFEGRKNKILTSSHSKVKIEKPQNPRLKELLDEYLQQNILLKSFAFPTKPQIKSRATITHTKEEDREVLNTSLENKDELDLLEHVTEKDKEMLQAQVEFQMQKEAKQSQARAKAKKQPNELKYEGDLSVYQLKIRSYRQFLFMVNLAHRIFDPLLLKDSNIFKPEMRYKYYLGKGNNYLLVKSLLKRRFWWVAQEDPKKANFVWTQLKVNYFYQFQHKSTAQQRHHKLDKDYPDLDSPRKKKVKQGDAKQAQSKAGIYKAPLPPSDRKIFTLADKKYYDDFLEKADNPQKLLKYSNRLRYFPQNFFRSRVEDLSSERVHNHLECNYFIGNKKALFYNLKQYYDLLGKNVFDIIPLTYHIKHGTTDPHYQSFTKQFKRLAKERISKKDLKNVWIVKPGELSNRGQGITVIDQIYELNNILKKKEKHFNGTEKTYIVQKYIQKPLLYKGRKFDIRHYMMISRMHGVMRAYWFGQGYIRTSSSEFNIDQISDQGVHLTNDAIQKYCDDYGKYEEGNKVSYNQFQRYMDATYGQGKFNFSEAIYPKMKAIALEAVKATYLQLDPNNTEHNFEVFGLDFMIDANLNVWLIEVNTNPCLQLSSKLLGRIIPTMVEHSLRLTLDALFPPPTHFPNSQKYLAPDNPLDRLQFQLIFDQDRDGQAIEQLFAHSKQVDMGQVDQEDETYENDGKQIELEPEVE